ncbi:ATP-dependent zinc metalloprotease FtsH [Roseimaritima ulvae]|uniref:ATP-dependent zinc metalloprotease FtsH n=1 Tax=Roseimaritima ulvae TaxID=980254 RepID=A0A5B9QWJ3_9BACT|nr:ATP-dependent zinc metalloprotease FtsH [Roseimaritima ulvae]QEG38323.1 ATP-dependent zinc metalloprotease FtsH 4 [Roseimaritima ulvae]
MSDQDKRKNPSGDGESRGGSVLLILLAIVGAVILCAYLIGNSSQKRLRYPDLVRLLEVTRYAEYGSNDLIPVTPDSAMADSAAADSATGDQAAGGDAADNVASIAAAPEIEAAGTIIVPSDNNPNAFVEWSRPQNIRVSEKGITGKAMFRQLGPSGDSDSEATEKTFSTQWTVRNEEQEQRMTALLDASNVVWDQHIPSTFWEDHGLMLLMMLILLGFGLMMLRRISGVGSPMSFSRSRGKLYAMDETSITFSDVAGIDEAVEEVREVVDFLKNAEKYQKLGGRIPKGVLLVGPPGTGKTLLARAIAGEAGTPFFSLSGSDFVEMYVGVGAARVRDMFQQAANRAPCIVFIDELDALGKSRSGSVVGGHDEREQTLNALLVEMDGFESDTNVIIVAATNRPETLDAALLRPGRFDRHVLVDRPDVGGREEILKVHVKNVKLDEKLDLHKIASITPGFVGADLANLVNEAALLAARVGKPAVGMQEFNEAVERVTAGLEKKNHVMNEDEKVRVAYHEAGHALVADALPNTDPVHKVSIIPRGMGALGYVMQRPGGDRYLSTKSELDSKLRVLVAGTLVEEMIFEDISTGASNDLERATEIARAMVMDYGMSRLGRVNYRQKNDSAFLGGGEAGHTNLHSEETAREIDGEVRRIIDEAISQTREILTARREALEAITQRLLEVEAIDGEELSKLIEAHSSGPLVVPGTASKKPRAKISRPGKGVEIAPAGDGQL